MEINTVNTSQPTNNEMNYFDRFGDETLLQIFSYIRSPDHKTFKSINLTAKRFYHVNTAYKHRPETEALIDTEFDYKAPEEPKYIQKLPLLITNKIVYFVNEGKLHAWNPRVCTEETVEVSGTPQSLSLLRNGKIFLKNEESLNFLIDPATLIIEEKYLPTGANIIRSNLGSSGAFAFMAQQTNKLILQDDIEADEHSRRELVVKPFLSDSPFQCLDLHLGNKHLFAAYQLNATRARNLHYYSLDNFTQVGKLPYGDTPKNMVSNDDYLIVYNNFNKLSVFNLHNFSHVRSWKWGIQSRAF